MTYVGSEGLLYFFKFKPQEEVCVVLNASTNYRRLWQKCFSVYKLITSEIEKRFIIFDRVVGVRNIRVALGWRYLTFENAIMLTKENRCKTKKLMGVSEYSEGEGIWWEYIVHRSIIIFGYIDNS